jgi:uncharacterized protein (TIGR02453 family)
MAAHFTSSTFRFLSDLAKNNNKAWFEKNKHRYEADFKAPALAFIEDFAPHLHKISPHFRADPRPSGGSLFRIHRDVRFSNDKSPYKTAIGIHFRHAMAKDAHTPGFYLHIQPKECFMGVGIWHPDSGTLAKIRGVIAEKPKAYQKSLTAKAAKSGFAFGGESLSRPPRGFDPEHPAIEDIKRKDYTAGVDLSTSDVTSADFLKSFARMCKEAAPVNAFLCGALGVPY